MDEDKLRKAIRAGNAAQSMIEGGPLEPVAFKDAVEIFRKELMDRWAVSKSQDERERIWVSVNMLERVADILNIVAANGRVAKGDLDRLIGKK